MGFYLRKSTKIGPFRLNLSKSGVGISAGVPGFRVSTGPRGAMVHIGRNGIYYRKSIGRSTTRPVQPIREHPTPRQNHDNLVEIDSVEASQIVDSDSQEIVELIRSTRSRFRFIWILLPLIIATFFWVPLIAADILLLPIFLIIDKKRHTSHIAYAISEEMESELQSFYDEVQRAFASHRTWHIPAEGAVSDWKRSGGADKTVRRQPIKVRWGNPKGVNTNVRVPAIPVGRQILYFLPDMVLIREKRTTGAVSYGQLNIEESHVNFLEEQLKPNDSELVGTTWRYVNKKGGPDRRFNNNYEIPIYRYVEIDLSSESGLHERVQMTNTQNIGLLSNAVRHVQGIVKSKANSEEEST